MLADDLRKALCLLPLVNIKFDLDVDSFVTAADAIEQGGSVCASVALTSLGYRMWPPGLPPDMCKAIAEALLTALLAWKPPVLKPLKSLPVGGDLSSTPAARMEEEESSFGKHLVVEEFITAPKRATPTIPTSKGPGRTGGPMHDAGGLCSPGRWQPRLRKLPPRAGFIRDRMNAWTQTWSQQPANGGRIGKDKWQHLVYSGLLGRLAKDPFKKRLGQLDGEARNYLTEKQCPVSKTAGRGTEEIDFALRFPLGMRCEDPEPMKEFLGPGVRISVDTQPKRTSTVWPAKQRRALGEMDPASLQELNDNFPSAREHAGLLQEDITELVKMGFMERMTYGEAWKRFSKISVAPLVVIVEETGQSRVLFDSSNYVQLNRQIKAQDIKVCHSAPDILGACSSMHWPRPIVSQVVDVSKAHRSVPVDERDWGLRAGSESPRPRAPALLAASPIPVNKVGTFGVASASWQWARAASLFQRLVYYFLEPPYLFRFTDDLMLIGRNVHERSFSFTRIALEFLVACSLVKTPFRWDKTRGGVQADFVGYFFDWENLVGGLSAKRADWLVNWARATAAAGIAVGRDGRAALGQFSFSTTPLKHLPPFLGPIYAGAAVIGQPAAWPLPPARIIIPKWLAAQVEQKHRVSLVQSAPVRARLRFKADARAEGDTVIAGGYELPVELTEQMSRQRISMDLRWQPRNENQLADDLTNEAFGSCCSTLRIPTPPAELPWITLPRLVEAAAQLHKELAEKRTVRLTARRNLKTKAHTRGKKKSGLRIMTHGEVSALVSCGWGRRPPSYTRAFIPDA